MSGWPYWAARISSLIATDSLPVPRTGAGRHDGCCECSVSLVNDHCK